MSATLNDLRTAVADLHRGGDFEPTALRVFDFQRTYNPAYRRFLQLAGKLEVQPGGWRDIPCVPIDLFRTQSMRSGQWTPESTFRSSGTTGAATSRHDIPDLADYVEACVQTFEGVVDKPLSSVSLLALLPSYLERDGSGLVAMVEGFMPLAAPGSGYYLYDHLALRKACEQARARATPILLWGVAYALLDLIDHEDLILPRGSMVMETGGMKGRRRELTREELHERLRAGIRLEGGSPAPIFSEYGMTEMNSQAYFLPDRQRFVAAPTLRISVRDLTDPHAKVPFGKTGGINVYDLANYATCSFFHTDDLGRLEPDGSFEVLGRQDAARVRGCNLLLGA